MIIVLAGAGVFVYRKKKQGEKKAGYKASENDASSGDTQALKKSKKLEGCSIRNATYLKMALNMLLHSKLRSWLTIIGIVIGVGAVVGIISLGDAMEASVQSSLADMDLTSITITPGYSKAQSHMPGSRGQRLGRRRYCD